MSRVCLIGFGSMGRVHFRNYLKLENEDFPIKLTAICDFDPGKFEGQFVPGNMETVKSEFDLSKYNLYRNIDEMIDCEKPDFVDICLPTYLHAEVSIKCSNKGIHVICEKPMALNSGLCAGMIEAAKKNGKKLMVGHCLRFWPEYEYLKKCIETGVFGEAVSAYFFRGGGTPGWSKNSWLVVKEKSGGCMFDLHVHDVDMANWLFGKPESVSSSARNFVPGSGYDIVSTNYMYNDGKVVNIQADWSLNGDFGFDMRYRVSFERANLVYQDGILKINPKDGKSFIPELVKESAYYREIRYFSEIILNNTGNSVNPPESSMETIKIVEAEALSADKKGIMVPVK